MDMDQITKELKLSFTGIDAQIDAIMKVVKQWHSSEHNAGPPVIINLVGITGTGKTAIVNKLAELLGLTNKFVRFDLSSSAKSSTVSGMLVESNILNGDAGIILLDEFTRWRNKTVGGEYKKPDSFPDLEEILSSGRATVIERELRMFYADFIDFKRASEAHELEQKALAEKDDAEARPRGKRKPRFMGNWGAATAANLLKMSVREIITTPYEELSSSIEQALDKPDTRKIDYSRCLFFTCSNLDGAFPFADSTINIDVGVLHQLTGEVNVGVVRRELSRFFTVETLGRLGSNYVLFPSLSKEAYQAYIAGEIYRAVKDKYQGVTITATCITHLCKILVIPNQGLRPVISNVRNFVRNLKEALANLPKDADVFDLDKVDATTYAVSYADTAVPFEFKTDNQMIEAGISLGKLRLAAVHEAAHAVIFMEAFKTLPLGASILSLTGGLEGHVIMPKRFMDEETHLLMIDVLLAGHLMVKKQFGRFAIGSNSDLKKATNMAYAHFNHHGFVAAEGLAAWRSEPLDYRQYTNNADALTTAVELTLAERFECTNEKLVKHQPLILALARVLLEKRSLNEEEIAAFMVENSDFELRSSLDDAEDDYLF